MKKGDVIQLTVIIISLFVGFGAIQYFFSAIANLIYLIGAGELLSTLSAPTFITLLVALFEGVVCWQLFIQSRRIADFIYDKTNIGTSFKIISQPNDLLYILFIVAAFYFLMENLPGLMKGLVNAFTTKAVNRFIPSDYDKPTDWTYLFLRLLLPLILLMAARPLADYFAKNISDEPIVIGDDIGNIEEKEITEP